MAESIWEKWWRRWTIAWTILTNIFYAVIVFAVIAVANSRFERVTISFLVIIFLIIRWSFESTFMLFSSHGRVLMKMSTRLVEKFSESEAEKQDAREAMARIDKLASETDAKYWIRLAFQFVMYLYAAWTILSTALLN